MGRSSDCSLAVLAILATALFALICFLPIGGD